MIAYDNKEQITDGKSEFMRETEKKAPLFPAFEAFVASEPDLRNPKGSLAAKLPRILGQGRTKTTHLDLPPAPIERRMELASLKLPVDMQVPGGVVVEIESVKREMTRILTELATADGKRRIAVESLRELSHQSSGQENNHYFAGGLVLVETNRAREWSWSLTPHYPLVSKIPPDVDYIAKAFRAAQELLRSLVLPVEEFESKLTLAWRMARHFSSNDDVLLVDVARMFKIAQQDHRFWQIPQKQFFRDSPEASFIANLINWRRGTADSGTASFELVPATLSQAHGPSAKPFFVPANPQGTQVKPMIYLRFRGRV